MNTIRSGPVIVPQPRRAADDLPLVALHTAINLAAMFASHTVTRWGLRVLAVPAGQAATELVRRAVTTTGIPDIHPQRTDIGELHLIRVRLQWIGDRVMVEVFDCDPTPPNPAIPLTIDAPGAQWGYRLCGTGKTVWCTLPLPQPPPRRFKPHITSGSG
jgi:hypothetical protein